MPTNAQEKTIRKSFVATFDNRPPIRLWGTFDAAQVSAAQAAAKHGPGDRLGDYTDGCVWDQGRQWGHCRVCYYLTKSGKRLYWGSYNSGQSYNGRDPETHRKFLKTIDDIRNYIVNHASDEDAAWHRVCHLVDPALIVDSDLL